MDNELIYRLLTGLAYATVFIGVAAYRRRAQGGESYDLRHEGVLLAAALRLGGLMIWLYPPVYALFPRLVAWAQFPVPPLGRWVAAAIALLVVPPLAFWAQRHLGRNVTPTVITKQDHELVTTGPYRYIRHPLYTAGIAFFLSLALLTASWFMLAAIGLTSIALFARIPKEESRLLERFGPEYEAYRRRTGRFLPKLR